MKIAIGSDHAGFVLKTQLITHLKARDIIVEDFGTHNTDPVDYPLYTKPVALSVSQGQTDRGIVLGGSGIGETMVANRFSGVRCALCWDEVSARLARQHSNANLIVLGERMLSLNTALRILEIWLETPFEGGRHQRRIDLIDAPYSPSPA